VPQEPRTVGRRVRRRGAACASLPGPRRTGREARGTMTSAWTRAAASFWLVGGALMVSGMFGGCGPTPDGPPETADPEPLRAPWFKDVTDEVGLDFVHDAGPVGSFFMPQALGSGAALFDFDGDGLLDIYLLQNGGPQGKTNRLY